MKGASIRLACLLLLACLAARAQDDARIVQDSLDVSDSSWIESAVFRKEPGATSGDLTVRIKGEDITYLDVPVRVWVAFGEAESAGAFYGEKIRNRYERRTGEPLWARHESRIEPPVEAVVQCAFNEDCETLLVRHIETSRESILVAAYAFTRTRIAAALVSAHVRGVDVKVKVDERQAEYTAADRQLKYLARNGIPVTRISMKGEYAAMHNKFMVIDGRYVIGGSYNFTTTAGSANWENVTLIDSPDIASRYAEAWKAVTSE